VVKKPQKRRPRPDLGCSAIGRKKGRKERKKEEDVEPVNTTYN
jgi:hypothetical protein